MYINKAQNRAVRLICFICMNFFGAVFIFMVMGVGIALVHSEETPDAVVGVIVFSAIIWAACFVVSYYQNRVKIYDSFFSNDPDGMVYPKVVARALGISEERVLKELQRLISKGYFHDCKLVYSENGEAVVMLTNPEITAANRMRYRVVNCRNCGGENLVRDGFVYGCKYCSGRIE